MRIIIFLIVLAICLVAFEVLAQPECMLRDTMVSYLENRYSERHVSTGLTYTGRLLEIFATDDKTSWTAILTNPKGVSCYLTSGAEWQSFNPEDKGT